MQKIYIFRKIPAINASFAQTYVHLQGWPLKSGKNIKDDVPDVSGSTQNIETLCKNKLKLIKLKDLYFKSTGKRAKERLMYVNTILKL